MICAMLDPSPAAHSPGRENEFGSTPSGGDQASRSLPQSLLIKKKRISKIGRGGYVPAEFKLVQKERADRTCASGIIDEKSSRGDRGKDRGDHIAHKIKYPRQRGGLHRENVERAKPKDRRRGALLGSLLFKRRY